MLLAGLTGCPGLGSALSGTQLSALDTTLGALTAAIPTP